MEIPRVFLDTTILKASTTALRRLLPRKQRLDWGGEVHEITVYDLGTINPNESLTGEIKAEAALLPTLAELGKQGTVRYCLHMETEFESWGLPKMLGNTTGRFYGAPIESAGSPIRYSRAMFTGYNDPREMQFDFISSLNHERFDEIQKITGAYQGHGKLNRNQLLDAFHIWCAEYNDCSFFLTLDFKLIKVASYRLERTIKLVRPSELLRHLT
jgi:hypothetical protein